jgi:hypothetical protein
MPMDSFRFLLGSLVFSVFSEASVSFDLQAGAGYRRDQQTCHIHEQNDDLLNSKLHSKMDPIHIAQIAGLAKLSLNHFSVGAQGDFGWVISGKDKSLLVINDEFSSHATFHSKVSGYVYDVRGFVAYRVPISKNRLYLEPEAGYALFVQNIKRGETHPRSALLNPSGYETILNGTSVMVSNQRASLEFKHAFKRTWFGPYVGGSALFNIYSKAQFAFGYFYHWLNIDYQNAFLSQFNANLEIFGIDVIAEVISDNQYRGNFHSKSAQKIYGSLTFTPTSRWYLELFASYLVFRTQPKSIRNNNREISTLLIFDTSVTSTDTRRVLSKTSGDWKSLSTLISVGYRF